MVSLDGSPRGKLGVEDWKKLLIGAALASFGVVVAAISQATASGQFDWRTTGWLALAAGASVIANGVRKFATDTGL